MIDIDKVIKCCNEMKGDLMKFQNIRHKTAVTKLQKDEEAEESAEIELKNATIEIDLNIITSKTK